MGKRRFPWLNGHMRARLVVLVALEGCLPLLGAGCFSNEYVISQSELTRLAGLPPSQRGARVHVVQALGTRATWAFENGDPEPSASYAASFAIYNRPEELAAARTANSLALLDETNPGPPSAPSEDFYAAWERRLPGTPPSGPSAYFAPSLRFPNFAAGHRRGLRDDLATGAIVVVAMAVTAAAGLGVTEGLRYDGHVQLHPEQTLHLRPAGGRSRPVALMDLTPADAVTSEHAVVRDDEDWGFRFGERRPLDRRGVAFKLDFGQLTSLCACYSATGFASNIQLGFFPRQHLGILATVTLGGGTRPLEHAFHRHAENLEAQAFLLEWWRLHLGVAAHGGVQFAGDEFGERTGLALGGGILLELALTTRLALTGRWDYTTAHTAPNDGGWAGLSIVTAGLAVY
jgi:hypothetical protein